MDKWQAIQSFWSSFGLPAYDENTVDESVTFPYITYSANVGSIDFVNTLNASLWYRGDSWKDISQKADAISEYLSKGILIPLDVGYVYLYRGIPFAQRMRDDSDSTVRRIYLNVNAEFLTDK